MDDTKFCRYCGKSISSDSVFCPFCGKEQDKITDKSVEKTSNINEPSKNNKGFNLSADVPRFPGRHDDTILENVQKYTESIGFSGEPITVYAYNQSVLPTLISPLLTAFGLKYFDIVLEDSGLLVLGLNIKSHFANKNSFIKFDDITEVTVKNHGLNYRIVLKTAGSTFKISIPKIRIGQKWQKDNVNKIVQALNERFKS